MFDKFWGAYPKKVARKDAEKRWKRLSETEQRAALEALPRHVKAWQGRETQYIPHASTWLNQARWEDELEDARPTVAWWATQEGVAEKGRELGIVARLGEDWASLRARIVAALRSAA